MKKFNFMLVALLSILAMASCEQEEEPVIPVIKSNDVVLTPDAQDAEIKYTLENAVAGNTISADSHADWISEIDFSEQGTVRFKVALNEGDSRTAEIILSYPEAADLTVKVTQQAAGYGISASTKNLSFVSQGGKMSLNVNSDRPWTLSGGAAWIKPSINEGKSGDVVEFTCEPSEELDPRETVFTFSCGGDSGFEVKAYQNQLGRIILEQATYNVPMDANELEVSLQANTDVKAYVSSPNSSWIQLPETKGMETKKFVFQIEANPEMEERSATVVFENADASEQIEIIQEAMYPKNVADMFKDENLKNYILTNFDANSNGSISREEAEAIEAIDAQFMEIADISGLELLVNLKKLNLNGNKLQNIDLTKNKALEMVNVNSNPKMGSLNISGLDKLTELRAGWSQMEELKAEGATSIKEVTLVDVRLTTLDITMMKDLEQFTISGATFPNVDLSQNTKLFYLSINNQELESIDMSALTELSELTLMVNSSITEFGIENLTKLGDVKIHGSGITQFSLPKAKKLWNLELNDSRSLKRLDVSKNFYLQRLDMTSCFALEQVVMFNGQVIDDMYGVDASLISYVEFEYPEDCSESIGDATLRQYVLDNFDTDKNGMVSKEEADMATVLNCSDMGIKSFTGLQFFEKIVEIDCSNNQITEINLTSQKLLEKLNASNNQLTYIDLNTNNALKELYLQHNQLSGINGIFEMREIVKADLSYNNLEGSFSFKNKKQLVEFNVSNNKLTEANTYMCRSMIKFDCSNNQITTFSLWSLKKMEDFNCSNNPVTAIPVEKVVTLKKMNCSNTNVTTLDLSNNTLMEQLICTECPDLTKIYVGDNTIADIQKDDTAEVVNGLPE